MKAFVVTAKKEEYLVMAEGFNHAMDVMKHRVKKEVDYISEFTYPFIDLVDNSDHLTLYMVDVQIKDDTKSIIIRANSMAEAIKWVTYNSVHQIKSAGTYSSDLKLIK